MDYETAKERLRQPEGQTVSGGGQAVDVMHRRCKTYKRIAGEVGRTPAFWSRLHRVFLLPEGIRWQVEENRISLGHACEIARLQGDDQWLLAFTVVEAKISLDDTKAVVNAVVNNTQHLQDLLETRIGIRFDEAKPLMIGLSFEDQFRIVRAAWTKKMSWADFSHRAIQEATRVDREHIACELERLADRLRLREDENR